MLQPTLRSFMGLLSLLLLCTCKRHTTELQAFEVPTPTQSFELPFIPDAAVGDDFSWKVFQLDSSEDNTAFQGFDPAYAEDPLSIFCFRGNPMRNSASRGNVGGKPTGLTLDWSYLTEQDTRPTAHGTWGGGTGWTGQALLIHWSREQKTRLGITDKAFLEDSNALEVIVGSLSGNIYFLNAENGKATRPALQVDGPIKGTVSVDPRKNGLLYVGQGIQQDGRFGAYVFDMFQGKEIYFQSGGDRHAARGWGAFDSNPLIDHRSGTVFWPAENGLVYALHSEEKKPVKMLRKYRYKAPMSRRSGVESSLAAIGNYGFFSDNDGYVHCMSLNGFHPIWSTYIEDDADATVVIDKVNSQYALYVGNEVDLRGATAEASLYKLDARNGEVRWRVSRTCRGSELGGKKNNGGILSTAVVGKQNCADRVFAVFSRTNEQNQGELVAIEKESGEELYSIPLQAYSWSTPVDFYDSQGRMYLFFTDVWGTVYLLDGKSGEILYKEKLNYTFESSPIMIGDRIIVGSRGRRILSFRVQCAQS